MNISRIICLIGLSAFSLLCIQAPAYADTYDMWGLNLDGSEPGQGLPPIPQQEPETEPDLSLILQQEPSGDDPGGAESNGPGETWAGGPYGGDEPLFVPQSLTTPPVAAPEPGSLLLLGTGMAGLALLRHRMNRRRE